MKSFIRLRKLGISFTALLIIVPNFSLAVSQQIQCPDVAERGYLNILTINLLFSEVKNRETRLEKIASFVKQQEQTGNPIDIILLQEVVGDLLSGTTNSSLDLKKLFNNKGIEYNLRYIHANGIPGIIMVGNAIFSRCRIIFSISKSLPFVLEKPFEGIEIPLKRKVLINRIEINNSKKINVYNTHLCSFCNTSDRLKQTQVLLKFIENVENLIRGENPVILGGDFNANLNILDDLPVYQLITNIFIDTYATFNNCTNCCSENDGFAGCTFAVPGNPFTIDPITGQPLDPERIDYIFIKGTEVQDSFAVFNSDPDWVSDHSGVLTRIGIR